MGFLDEIKNKMHLGGQQGYDQGYGQDDDYGYDDGYDDSYQGNGYSGASGEGGLREKLLTVYTLTGEAREGLANIGSRFVLTQQVEAVFAARIGDAWNITLDEQSLRERFSLITAEWTMGDN